MNAHASIVAYNKYLIDNKCNMTELEYLQNINRRCQAEDSLNFIEPLIKLYKNCTNYNIHQEIFVIYGILPDTSMDTMILFFQKYHHLVEYDHYIFHKKNKTFMFSDYGFYSVLLRTDQSEMYNCGKGKIVINLLKSAYADYQSKLVQ